MTIRRSCTKVVRKGFKACSPCYQNPDVVVAALMVPSDGDEPAFRKSATVLIFRAHVTIRIGGG